MKIKTIENRMLLVYFLSSCGGGGSGKSSLVISFFLSIGVLAVSIAYTTPTSSTDTDGAGED